MKLFCLIHISWDTTIAVNPKDIRLFFWTHLIITDGLVDIRHVAHAADEHIEEDEEHSDETEVHHCQVAWATYNTHGQW